jgi:hypothetical protein
MADNTTPDEGEDDLRADLEAAFKADAETQDAAPEPEAEPEQTEKSDRPRDEHGRFAKVEKTEEIKPEEPAKTETPAETQQAKPVQEQKPAEAAAIGAPSPTSGPPPGWSVAAKTEYDKLPQSVKDSIAKREEEINRGFQKLQDYKGLDHYNEMARNSGTTLDQALARYTAAEDLLSRNFSQGIVGLCQNYGYHPQRLIAELQAMIGQGGQSAAPEAMQAAPQLHPILSEVQALKQWQQSFIQQQEQQQAEAINSQLASFAADPANKFFENVRQDMAALINAGKASTLEDAYDQACWLNPEIRQLRIKDEADKKLAEQQAAVNQARKASASLPTGSPASVRKVSSSSSVRDAVLEAWNEHTV